MASNSNKGKGKGGFGMTHRHKKHKLMLDSVNRMHNMVGCAAKREAQREREKQSNK